jgi:coatomer protein complex subunit alpha (xenin)
VSSLAADHVVAGSFESAARLLHDQLGVVNMEPFRQQFMVMFARMHTSFTAMPGLMPLASYPQRSAAGPKASSLPAVA